MSEHNLNIHNDEYHKIGLLERLGYGMGDFANNLTFGTVGGFFGPLHDDC